MKTLSKLALCLLLAMSLTVSAFAAQVPDSLVAENLNGQQRLVKTYTLSPEVDPDELKEEDFSYQVLASNLLTSNNYSFSLNAIPMQAGEVVTDIYFDFGKVPVGFQSVVNPTLSVMVNGNAVNGYQMVNRADVGGKYQGTWQTATASWVTIIRRLWNTPTLPKTGY